MEQSGLKHLCWAGFNVVQAGVLAPMYFFAPAVLARAALYTTGIVGSLAFVGATAKETQYLYMGGPLLAGVDSSRVVGSCAAYPACWIPGIECNGEGMDVWGSCCVFWICTVRHAEGKLRLPKPSICALTFADPGCCSICTTSRHQA